MLRHVYQSHEAWQQVRPRLTNLDDVKVATAADFRAIGELECDPEMLRNCLKVAKEKKHEECLEIENLDLYRIPCLRMTEAWWPVCAVSWQGMIDDA